jgi:MFS family permease
LELGIAGIIAAGIFAWLAAEDKQSAPAKSRVVTRTIFPTTTLWLWFVAAAFAFSLRDFAGWNMGTLSSLFLQNAHGYDAKLAGLALSVLFIASVISNPLFGHLSDHARKRWTAFVTAMAALLIAVFPRLPDRWLVPCLAAYGFFFMSNYPMVEAELMQSVPDAVRGRVFGLFITVGGLVGNVSHWITGAQVKRMGDAARTAGSYYLFYEIMGGLVLLSLLGLACLHAIRKREDLNLKHALPESAIRHPQSAI